MQMFQHSKRAKPTFGVRQKATRWAIALALFALGSILAACGSSTTSAPIATVSIPRGWKPHAYSGIEVSAPRTWLVNHNPASPKNGEFGTLNLGESQQAGYSPNSSPARSTVTIATTPFDNPFEGKRENINGLTVFVGFGSPSTIQWSILTSPTTNYLEVIGYGPLADKVMHTLRPGHV
jgi:hypothetical protein